MKKNIAAILCGAVSLGFFAGCASNKVDLSAHSPVAVVSVIGNSSIPWVKEEKGNGVKSGSDGLLTNMVNKMIDGDNPEMTTAVDRLDYAAESFSKILPELAGCEVLPSEQVVNNEFYQDMRGSFYNSLISTKSATNYKDFTTLKGKNAAQLASELNAKSLAILNFTFEKKLTKGNKWNGECQVVVTMKAKILDEKGKELVNKTYSSQSAKVIRIRNHKYEKQEVSDNSYDEIDNVIRKFAAEFLSGEAEATSETDETESANSEINAASTSLPKPEKKSASSDSESAAAVNENATANATSEPETVTSENATETAN